MILSLLLALAMFPQSAAPDKNAASKEDQDLERALGEAGNSPIEYSRAIERQLKKYPKSERRTEYERVLAQAAIDMRDKRRILLYGIPAIESGVRSAQLLDHVTRTLLDKEDQESNERALKYARILVDVVSDQRKAQLESKEYVPLRGRRLDETEYAIARGRTFEARALANLGRFDESVDATLKGWEICPTVENARERSRSLDKAGKSKEALAAFAEALALAGDRTGSTEPFKDRARLAELSRKASGSDSAFGEVLLAAYDRVGAIQAARDKRIKAFDPNNSARTPHEFTLSGTQGDRLDLASLKGKVVVIDFWATWCGPCRAQHPLYEQVKQRFKSDQNIVFLAVSTDESRDVVVPFLKAQKWSPQAYYEDGLATLLRVSSIPTTVILDRQGAVVSRLNGFIADRFVDMLSERIREAMQEN